MGLHGLSIGVAQQNGEVGLTILGLPLSSLYMHAYIIHHDRSICKNIPQIMHVYTFEAKTTPNLLSPKHLGQKPANSRGEHPLDRGKGASNNKRVMCISCFCSDG